MTDDDGDRLTRQYAAVEIAWHALRERGFEDDVQGLGAMGELGLRPPVAAQGGPNAAARRAWPLDDPGSDQGCPVRAPYRLIVTDTSPLFTLVLADSSDVLLRAPGCR